MNERLRQLRATAGVLSGTASALAQHHLLGRQVPLSVTLAPTNQCPGRCAYCGIWEIRQDGERSPEWWIELLATLRAHGTRRVGFTGGEPLSYDGIERLVRAARDLRLMVTMGTNGLLVPERSDVVRDLDVLVVSLDGPREVNDRQRFPGAFDAAVRAVGAAHTIGTRVWLTSVLTRATAETLPELLALADQLDVRANLQIPFHPPDYCGRDNGDRFPTPPQVQEILRLARENNGPGGSVLNTNAYWDHVERWSALAAVPLEAEDPRASCGVGPARCVGGELFFHVEPDGRLYACTQVSDQLEALRPGPTVPLRDALRVAGDRSNLTCVTCLSSYAQEQSLLFGLSPTAMWAWLREMLG